MELRDLEYLVASASAGTFGRAAQSLGLTTSTISRRVGVLEDELGLALFERGHSGIRLTAGGRAVMRHVRRALAEMDAIKRAGSRSGSGDAGEIRLGVRLPPVAEPFAQLLANWRERHPNVRLTVSEMNDRDLAAGLEERRLDVALTSGHAATEWTVRQNRFAAGIRPASYSIRTACLKELYWMIERSPSSRRYFALASRHRSLFRRWPSLLARCYWSRRSSSDVVR